MSNTLSVIRCQDSFRGRQIRFRTPLAPVRVGILLDELPGTFAHIAPFSGRISQNEGVVRYIPGNDRTGSDECKLSDDDSAQEGRIGSDRCTVANQRRKQIPTGSASRPHVIGKSSIGPDKNPVFYSYLVPKADAILDRDQIPNDRTAFDEYLLADVASAAHPSTLHDVGKSPHSGVRSDFVGLNECLRMFEVVHRHETVSSHRRREGPVSLLIMLYDVVDDLSRRLPVTEDLGVVRSCGLKLPDSLSHF